MARRRNRYKNALGVSSLVRWISIAAVLGVTGSSYVYIKNQYVAKSDSKKFIEEEIKRFDREIEAEELRVARMESRDALQRKLDFTGSSLKKITPPVVERISGPDQSQAYAVETQGGR
jgi:hypothetical protein